MLKTAAALTRLGTETAFDVLARAGALTAAGRDVINLGIGQPDFPTPEHIVEAAVKALRDGEHGYTPAAGITALRESVAGYLAGQYGVAVDPGRVLIVPGGKVTMWFAILMFGEPGAEILYPDPGFPIYHSVIAYSGATPVGVPLLEKNGFALDPDDVLSRITGHTRLVILNSPANPTGGVSDRAIVDRLVAGLRDFPDVAILSDEIYARMLYDGRVHTSLLTYPELEDRLILLDGWSKTYAMTGWRMGFGVWPESLIARAERLAINSHSCVNAATQHAGIAALDGPQDGPETMVEAFTARRRAIVDGLNALPGFRCAEPYGAFYAFPNIEGTGRSSKEMQDWLLEELGIAAIAGTSFGANGEGYLRFSYANSQENIERALERIGKAL